MGASWDIKSNFFHGHPIVEQSKNTILFWKTLFFACFYGFSKKYGVFWKTHFEKTELDFMNSSSRYPISNMLPLSNTVLPP